MITRGRESCPSKQKDLTRRVQINDGPLVRTCLIKQAAFQSKGSASASRNVVSKRMNLGYGGAGGLATQ
jgi:hypothetical protein